MLPEQQDILWTFLTLAYTFFAFFAFGNVIKHCRERGDVNTTLWGGIFGVLALISFFETVHMFDLTQQEQIGFFFQYQILTVFCSLAVLGCFFQEPEDRRSVASHYPGIFLLVHSVRPAGRVHQLVAPAKK